MVTLLTVLIVGDCLGVLQHQPYALSLVTSASGDQGLGASAKPASNLRDASSVDGKRYDSEKPRCHHRPRGGFRHWGEIEIEAVATLREAERSAIGGIAEAGGDQVELVRVKADNCGRGRREHPGIAVGRVEIDR